MNGIIDMDVNDDSKQRKPRDLENMLRSLRSRSKSLAVRAVDGGLRLSDLVTPLIDEEQGTLTFKSTNVGTRNASSN